MKKSCLIISLIGLFFLSFTNFIFAETASQNKFGGLLLKRTFLKRAAMDSLKKGKTLSQKKLEKLNIFGDVNKEIIAIYLTQKPDKLLEEKLNSLGINRRNNVWIPAVGNHKFGFAMYDVPINKIEIVAELSEIMRIESLEQTYNGQLREANGEKGINARYVWDRFDYYGQGVNIGIIDTGYDVGNPDLPVPIATWKYTNGVLVTNADVADNNSGHGTYIAGCIVGNGTLANENDYDYMNGIAPSASVHIVKASITTSSEIEIFRSDILVQALYDLAENNCVKIINMSLGGWDAYHDGSSPLDQTVDFVTISKGIPVFCAAGNLGNKKQYVFAEIDEFEAKEIKFTVLTTNAEPNSVAFNLIWTDDYDEEKHELFYDGWDILPQNPPILKPFDGNVYIPYFIYGSETYSNYFRGETFDYTISPRGKVKQKWYWLNEWMNWQEDPEPKNLRYKTIRLHLTNKVNEVRYFHLYIDNNRVVDNEGFLPKSAKFEGANSKYTVTSPGTADRAFTIGSFASRTHFSNRAASNKTTMATAGITLVSAFSGRGPRVDQTNLREKDEYSYEEVRYEHVKPDFLCPGELVISVLNRKTRDDYDCPPFYAIDNVASQTWQRSLPSWEEFYFEEKENEYTNLNYFCPLGIFGDIFYFDTNSTMDVNSYTSNYRLAGTSPASAFGAGSAALLLQKWPCMQVEELRRYMRPGTPAYPHYPSIYNIKDGFGRLYLEDIFKYHDDYVDEKNFLDFLSLVPNSETDIVIENDDTIWVTNSSVTIKGDYKSVFCPEEFYITNFLTGWSKDVNYVNLSNRIWWVDGVVLSNYAKQRLGVCLVLDIPDGSFGTLDESILIRHSHGLESPTISITNPVTTSSIFISNLVDEIYLSGVWMDDRTVVNVLWMNSTMLTSGYATTTATGEKKGTWSANIPLLEHYENNITIKATDNDGESSSDTIQIIFNELKKLKVYKMKYFINRKKTLKNRIKFNSKIISSRWDMFEDFDRVTADTLLSIKITNTYLVFGVAPTKIKKNGEKAIYLLDGKKGKIIVKRKNSKTGEIKVRMKNIDGLAKILGIKNVTVEKRDKLSFDVNVTVFIGNIYGSDIEETDYWGKSNKWHKGKQ